MLRMGKYDEAIADYDASLQIDSSKVASLYGRGMAKRRKGDYAGGNIDIAAAKAVKPSITARVRALRPAAAAHRAVRSPDAPAAGDAVGARPPRELIRRGFRPVRGRRNLEPAAHSIRCYGVWNGGVECSSKSDIKEHMEVLGSDGQHVGTVDHLEGSNQIKLDPRRSEGRRQAPSDPDGLGGSCRQTRPSQEVEQGRPGAVEEPRPDRATITSVSSQNPARPGFVLLGAAVLWMEP